MSRNRDCTCGPRRRRADGGHPGQARQPAAGPPGDPRVGLRQPHLEGPGLLRPGPRSSTACVVAGPVPLRPTRSPSWPCGCCRRWSISALFIVGHDAAHEALFKTKRMNSIVGHLAMLPSWHVYEGWVLGHNRIHHKYTVRQGMDFVWHPYTAEQYAAMMSASSACATARVVVARRRRLLHPRDLVAQDDGGRAAGPLGQGHPPRPRIIVYAWIVATVRGRWPPLGFARYGTVRRRRCGCRSRCSVIPFLAFNYVIGSVVHVHHIAARPSAGGRAASGPSSRARWRAPRSCGWRPGSTSSSTGS